MMRSFPPTLSWLFCLSVLFYLSILQYSLCQTFNGTNNLQLNLTVPAIFALGDSLIDTGNNNNLPLTLIKSNLPPYGMNFEGHKATGRFTDGRLTIDFFAEALGIKKYVHAYLDPKLDEEDLLTGVSFGSAGTGFDPRTSRILLVRSMSEQLKMLRRYRRKVRSIVGRPRADFIISKSIFIVAAGSSDLANTYFALPYRRNKYVPNAYTSFLMRHATRFLQKLYRFGARKIGLINIPPLGLTPIARTLGGGRSRKPAENYNTAANKLNTKLNLEVQYLNSRLHNPAFVYIDIYSIMLDIVLNKTQYGFDIEDRGCCGSGLVEVGPLCNAFSEMTDVKKCVFWDSYHPTEAVYNITATQIIKKYFHLFF
ncbi:hypothetical protein RND81_01G001600 [Saponaria officinalis]|uniref:Uncharacterized protein n=1 Tax=Saponaria officinalis TaxID=3572 RepID=A0AAW1N5A5_SAPOF